MKPVTFAICGCGSRGLDAYATYQLKHPESMKIVAVADIRPERLEKARALYHIPEECCFASGEEMLEQPRLADVMIVATQDRQHVGHALPALERGYNLIVEKPISPSLSECLALKKRATELGRKVIVCHVLRYSPFYDRLHRMVAEGAIGRLETIEANENVGYWHFAHSYVRGNWRNLETSSPVILAKNCHDMDIIRWLADAPCLSVSSVGGLDWFKQENAPEGATLRCHGGCRAKVDCPYDCDKLYIEGGTHAYASGNRGWPLNVLTNQVTPENLTAALDEGPYGRCVYHCDNDVADHQALTMAFANGVTAAFNVTAFSNACYRTIHLSGTKGEIDGNLEENKLYFRPFNKPVECIDLSLSSDQFAGHGGGDERMMAQACRLFAQDGEGQALTSIDASVESHVMALAAEASRAANGRQIMLNEFCKSME